MSPRPLLRTVLTVASCVLLGLGTTTLAAPGAQALAPASATHPFSDPVYWPLRVETHMDCYRNNPGCKGPHKYWMLDVVPTGQNRGISHAGVYAMGAGILHVAEAHGPRCGTVSRATYGTSVWIDHGAGIVSKYGHLSTIVGREGQHVAAGQKIGVVGTTGKDKNCHVAYLDFATQRNGLKVSHGYDFGQLRACAAGTGRTESWPKAFSGKTKWNSLRTTSTIPASSSACLPKTAPATPVRPAKTRVKAGKTSLTVRWTRPPAGVNAVMVEVSTYHPSGRYWDLPRNQRWVKLSASRTSTVVSGLMRHRAERVRVSFHNRAGWSAPSSWVRKSTTR